MKPTTPHTIHSGLPNVIDAMDDEVWNYADALDDAVEDLDEQHRILRDAMHAAALAGYERGRMASTRSMLSGLTRRPTRLKVVAREGVPA